MTVPFLFKKPPLELEKVRITTSRLLLRPVVLEDAPSIFTEFTPEIVRYMRPSPAKVLDDTKKFVNSAHEGMKEGDDLQMVITAKDSREFLGCVGLHSTDTEQVAELGIWVKKSAHGQGYGREAVVALHAWASTYLRVRSFVYPVSKFNTSSRAIAESLRGTVIKENPVTYACGNQSIEVLYTIPPATSGELTELSGDS